MGVMGDGDGERDGVEGGRERRERETEREGDIEGGREVARLTFWQVLVVCLEQHAAAEVSNRVGVVLRKAYGAGGGIGQGEGRERRGERYKGEEGEAAYGAEGGIGRGEGGERRGERRGEKRHLVRGREVAGGISRRAKGAP